MTTDNRVVLDYTNRDYKSIRSMLVGLAQGFLPEWGTVGETGDFGTLLLELFAYNGDIMNYYIDRVGAEAFLGTAARRQSVMFIADMLGYIPIGQQAARVPLTFSWQWDTAQTQVGKVTYTVLSRKVDNGIVTLDVSSPDIVVSLEPGQSFTLVLPQLPSINGVYVIETTSPATLTEAFSLTFYLSEDSPLGDLTKATVGPGSSVSTGAAIVIPAGTTVSSAPDSLDQAVTFELDSDVFLDSGQAVKVPTPGYVAALDPYGVTPSPPDPSTLMSVTTTASATEGQTVTPVSLGASKGVPNADFVLTDIGIVDNSVQVYTKEGGQAVVWTRINTLTVAGPDQSVFSYFVDDEDQTHILFGDNASGRIPPVNSEIFVGYRVGVGVNANSLGIGTITNLSNDYATAQGVTVTNTASPTGGADIESTDSMRFSIPRSNAVRRRAVNLDDYKSLALQVPGVTKALAYGDSYTSVFLRIASNDQSRAYVTDRLPYIKTGGGSPTIKAITALDHSGDLHPGESVYISTKNATGSFKIRKMWQSLPTTLIGVSRKELTTLYPAQYPQLGGPQSSAKLTCFTPHGLVPGQPFKVTGLGVPYDGTWIVGSVPDTDRKTLTYHCSKFIQPNLSVDATVSDYLPPYTPLDNVVAGGVGTVSAASGIELECPEATKTGKVGWNLYHPTGKPAETDSPNLSFIDPQMKDLIATTEDYLSDKEIVGATTYAEPVEWTNVIMALKVKVGPLYNRTSVRNAVKEAVKGVYAYDNVDFGKQISLGEVYRAALVVDGVEFITINSMYIGDASVTLNPGSSPGIVSTTVGVIVPAAPGVRDILTPPRSIPRMDPATLLADTWVTSTGGLVNT